jgi:hypothetical protein
MKVISVWVYFDAGQHTLFHSDDPDHAVFRLKKVTKDLLFGKKIRKSGNRVAMADDKVMDRFAGRVHNLLHEVTGFRRIVRLDLFLSTLRDRLSRLARTFERRRKDLMRLIPLYHPGQPLRSRFAFVRQLVGELSFSTWRTRTMVLSVWAIP